MEYNIFEGLPKLSSTSEEKDPIVKKKLLSPLLDWEWYLIEGDEEEGIFFAFVKGFFNEFGTVSLEELQNILAFEDKTFKECPVSKVM